MKTVTNVNLIKNSKRSTENIMNNFLGKLSLKESKWDKPLKLDGDTDLHLFNPYSPVVCWVLYLYSMELGSPPLYMELNRASREMDLTNLSQLGPFAIALYLVCMGAEENKK